MKKILLIILVELFGFQCFGQDPDLFQTWYLNNLGGEVFDPIYVSEINPPIAPTLTIDETLNFIGEGACNTFTGAFTFLDPNLENQNFNHTNTDCIYESHTNFENFYFSFFETEGLIFYTITTENGIQHLSLDNQIFEGLSFSNQILATANLTKNNFHIYPNPVTNNLFIAAENTVIEKITVYAISGKMVVEHNNLHNNSINVSNLSKGMYFIEITSTEGKTVKRFIKK